MSHASSSFFTYEGYLTDASHTAVGLGTPETVPFRLKILGRNSVDQTSCELYREQRAVTVQSGNFTIPVGSSEGATVTAPTGMTFTKMFGSTNVIGQGGCLFEPAKSGSYRGLEIEIDREGSWIELGEIVLAASPRAMVADTAEKLGDFQSANFLRVVESGVPQSLGAWSSANYSKLVDLITSTQVVGGVANISGTSSGFTGNLAGDVTGTQSVTQVTAIQGRSIGNVSPQNGQALTWVAAQNRWEPAALPTQLPPMGTAGGSLQGTYPNPTLKNSAVTFDKLAAGSAGGDVLQFTGSAWTASALRYTALRNSLGQSPWPTSSCQTGEALSWSAVSDSFACQAITLSLADGSVTDQKISGVLVSKIQSGSGSYFTYAPNNQVCTTGQVLKWNSGRWECGVDSIGLGIETDPTVQSFAKNAPASADFTVSSGVLTLNTVPVSKGGTGATTATAALTALLPAQSGHSGKVLGTDGTTTSWVAVGGGTVTSISTGSGLTGGPITTTGTLGVDTGTTAGKILMLDGSARIPAVNGSLLTSLNASELSSGTIPVARMPSLVGDVTSSGVTATVVKIRGRAISTTAPADGQTLKWNNTAAEWQPSSAGLGTVTQVSVDPPLTIVTGSTTPYIMFPDGSLTGAKIANGTITDAKVSSVAAGKITGVLDAARLPALTGDVTSTSGTATTTVAKIRGRAVSATAPAAGQVLKWNNGTAQWEPSDDLTSGGNSLSCPGMIPVPAIPANGYGEFCISSEGTASSYATMNSDCHSAGSRLCSAFEIRRYCAHAGSTFSAAWSATPTGTISSSGLDVFISGCSGGTPTSGTGQTGSMSSSKPYRCCRN